MRVLLAMSGGVDSSMAAYLLKKQGFEIVGITFVTYVEKQKNKKKYNLDYINDARQIAVNLGFKHYVVDIQDIFKNQIITNFVDEYLSGRTPNPCVVCNPSIKWKTLMEYADEFECKYVATGHYAVVKNENDRFYISEAIDDWKDQSYFLWKLPQEYLKKTIFPLGKYKKTEIKLLAKKLGFVNLIEKKESYNVCFIKDKDYRFFIKEFISKDDQRIEKGSFVNYRGEILGQHNGIHYYTIGQKKGLNIESSKTLYVVKIEASTNTVFLGQKEELSTTTVTLSDFNFQKYVKIPENIQIFAKIRYKEKATLCNLIIENEKIKVVFFNKIYGVASGQSVVFYQNNDLIGGGIIV